MGGNLSAGTGPLGPPGELHFYDIPQFIPQTKLGEGKILKSVKCMHDKGPVVVKVFIKRDSTLSLQKYIDKLKIMRNRLPFDKHPSVLLLQKIENTEKAAYIVRQYTASNLFDRFHTHPFLLDIERRWLAFQLLTAVGQCHAAGITHGDIKSENILLTSWNWLFLSDFAFYKPTLLPINNPAEYRAFFSNNTDAAQKRCYVAPERFVGSKINEKDLQVPIKGKKIEVGGDDDRVTPAMDIFSCGCVIAEMYLGGDPIFDLEQLLRYRDGAYDPMEKLKKIKDPMVRGMVTHMIQRDPLKRHSALSYIRFFTSKIFPRCFVYLYKLHANLLNPDMADPDMKVQALMQELPEALFQVAGVPREISRKSTNKEEIDLKFESKGQSTETLISDLEAFQTSLSIKIGTSSSEETASSLLSFKNNVERKMTEFEIRTRSVKEAGMQNPVENNGHGLTMLISCVCACLCNVRYPLGKLTALDLLKTLGEHVGIDEVRVSRIVPYCVSMASDAVSSVRAAAVKTLEQVVRPVISCPVADVYVFPEYVFPALARLAKDHEELVQLAYAQSLAGLGEAARRVLDYTYSLQLSSTEKSYDAELGLIQDFLGKSITELTISDSEAPRALLSDLSRFLDLLGIVPLKPLLKRMVSVCESYEGQRQLQIEFLQQIPKLCPVIDSKSFMDYLLPYILGASCDMSEDVVLQAVQCLYACMGFGLLGDIQTFQIVAQMQPLLVHPNVHIRTAAIRCLGGLGQQLGPVKSPVFLVPWVTNFLQHPIFEVNEEALTAALKPPMSRRLFSAAMNVCFTGSLGEDAFAILKDAQKNFERSSDNKDATGTQISLDDDGSMGTGDADLSDPEIDDGGSMLSVSDHHLSRLGSATASSTKLAGHDRLQMKSAMGTKSALNMIGAEHSRRQYVRGSSRRAIVDRGRSKQDEEAEKMLLPDSHVSVAIVNYLNKVVKTQKAKKPQAQRADLSRYTSLENDAQIYEVESALTAPLHVHTIEHDDLESQEFSALSHAGMLIDSLEVGSELPQLAADGTSNSTENITDEQPNERTLQSNGNTNYNKSSSSSNSVNSNNSDVKKSPKLKPAASSSMKTPLPSKTKRTSQLVSSPSCSSFLSKSIMESSESSSDDESREKSSKVLFKKSIVLDDDKNDEASMSMMRSSSDDLQLSRLATEGKRSGRDRAHTILGATEAFKTVVASTYAVVPQPATNAKGSVIVVGTSVALKEPVRQERDHIPQYIQKALCIPKVLPTNLGTAQKHRSSTSSFFKNHHRLEAGAPMNNPTTWRPKGVLVSELVHHKSSVNEMAVSRDNLFLATGSSDGTVAIWDCQNLTTNMVTPTAVRTHEQGGEVTSVCVCDGFHSVASASSNGSLHLFRVDANQSGDNIEYGNLAKVTNMTAPEGGILAVKHFNRLCQSLLVYGTRHSIRGWDLRSSVDTFNLHIPEGLGYLSCLCVGPSAHCVCAGTTRGFVIVWDIRLQIPIHIWRHNSKRKIVSISAEDANALGPEEVSRHKTKQHGPILIISAEGTSEISAFDCVTGACRMVFRLNTSDGETPAEKISRITPGSEKFQLSAASSMLSIPFSPLNWPALRNQDTILMGRPADPLPYNLREVLLDELRDNPNTPKPSVDDVTFSSMLLCHGSYGITAGSDRSMRFWDIESPADSYVLNSPLCFEHPPSYELRDEQSLFIFEESLPRTAPSNTLLDSSIRRGPVAPSSVHKDIITDLKGIEFPTKMLASSSRDGIVKIWV